MTKPMVCKPLINIHVRKRPLYNILQAHKHSYILLLLLLAVITYNQVQSFQINDYMNHYVDIEIMRY